MCRYFPLGLEEQLFLTTFFFISVPASALHLALLHLVKLPLQKVKAAQRALNILKREGEKQFPPGALKLRSLSLLAGFFSHGVLFI